MNYKNCIKCKSSYSTGKDYEDVISSLPKTNAPTSGLCPFCNKKSKYYICQHPIYKLHVKGWLPYWVSRFVNKTDGLSFSNWEYVQWAVFGRWAKTKYEEVVIYKDGEPTRSTFSYRGIDKESYEKEKGKSIYS